MRSVELRFLAQDAGKWLRIHSEGRQKTFSRSHRHVVDTISKAARSALMARIRSKNSKPELAVRKLVHGLGFRYCLHDNRLPGSPDLTFPRRRKVIFVNGCFWHRHPGCKFATTPSSNKKYWARKFENTKKRDKTAILGLRKLGWNSMVVWECEVDRPARLISKLRRFLSTTPT